MSEPKNEIVVYQPNAALRLEVMLNRDTVWLNRQQLSQLFGRDVKTIGKHIANVLHEELAPAIDCAVEENADNPTVAKFATVQVEGARKVVRQVEYYSLEMITSIGYRVKSLEGVMFRRWANKVLRDYLLRGVAINARINQLEDKADRRFASHEKRIAAVEQRVDFVVKSALPAPEMVFMEGEFLSAHDAIRKIVLAAKRRLVLIDNYIDERVLTLLAERRAGVSCHVYGKNVARRDMQLAFSRFQQQYPNDTLQLTQWTDAHDRFIICDDTVWICGASVKDAGRRMFALIRMTTSPDFILSALPVVP